jgi:pimeloyl-ACP methyl ester carboxylesterase
MTFFSGFCLHNESELFGDYLDMWRDNPYVVAGFSYGAIKALEYTLSATRRIDRLLLLSPAWFVDKERRFIKQQTIFYRKDPTRYRQTFYRNVAYPSNIDLSSYAIESPVEDLQALLTYPWPKEKLEAVAGKGVRIETYLGAKDRIINAEAAHEFFKAYSTSHLFKPFGHLLR